MNYPLLKRLSDNSISVVKRIKMAKTGLKIQNSHEVEHESKLQERFGVKTIGVFGSYVRGEQKKGSDIDILVEFYPYPEMDLIKFVELEEYLS